MTTPKFEILESSPLRLVEAEDDTPMLGHFYCVACYTPTYMGMPALCGEQLLDIPVAEDAEQCKVCVSLRFDIPYVCCIGGNNE